MRVLITGISGTVGSRLARRLFEAGHDISALGRGASNPGERIGLPVRAFQWSELESKRREIFDGVEAVVHLAGDSIAEGRWTPQKKRSIIDSRVETGRALMSAIEKLPSGRPRVLISASGIGYYGDRGDESLTESSSRGTGFLSDVCQQWESSIADAQMLGVRAVVFRIAAILARGQGMLGELVPVFKRGLGGPVGGGKQWLSWVHLDDVTRAIEHAIAHPLQGAYNLVAPEVVRQGDFARSLGRTVGLPACVPAPAFALKLALGEKAAIVLESQRASADRLLSSGFTFHFPKLESALADTVSPAGEERFESWQFIQSPIEEVFRFFSDEANLERITPEWLGFSVLGKSDPEIREGTLIDYKLKIRGVPVKWQTRIESWKPPRSFRDTQLKGPYHIWEHDHLFESARGGTIMRDQVRYALPLRALGAAVAGGWIDSDVRKIFEYRQRTISQWFGSKN